MSAIQAAATQTCLVLELLPQTKTEGEANSSQINGHNTASVLIKTI